MLFTGRISAISSGGFGRSVAQGNSLKPHFFCFEGGNLKNGSLDYHETVPKRHDKIARLALH